MVVKACVKVRMIFVCMRYGKFIVWFLIQFYLYYFAYGFTSKLLNLLYIVIITKLQHLVLQIIY